MLIHRQIKFELVTVDDIKSMKTNGTKKHVTITLNWQFVIALGQFRSMSGH